MNKKGCLEMHLKKKITLKVHDLFNVPIFNFVLPAALGSSGLA